MSRSSKLYRTASVKSDVTGMISIAAFMGSCLLPLLSATPREILTGDVATDADQFLVMTAARQRPVLPRGGLIGRDRLWGLARVHHGRRKAIRPKKGSDVPWAALESIDSDRAAGLSGVFPEIFFECLGTVPLSVKHFSGS